MLSAVVKDLNLSVIFAAVGGLAILIIIRWMVEKIKVLVRINRALSPFPAMEWHWLYGSLSQARKGGANSRFLQEHINRARANPRAYRIWQGPLRSNLIVVHPETVRPILKVSDPKSFVYDVSLKPWLGDGLLISSRQKWARNRRLLTPAFHFDILRPYVNIFNDASDVFINKLEGFIDEEKSLALFEHVSLLTLDIILQCAFSYSTDCQIIGMSHPYIAAVYDLARTWFKRTGNITMFLFPAFYWLTPEGRKFKRLCKAVHKEADTIIASRREILKEQGDEFISRRKTLDFLDILLTARDADGNGMSHKEMRAEVDTFLFEGHDTTASGLSWTLYLLAKHPQYQTEVQKEVDEVIDSLGSDRLDWASLSRMPFLTRCLKESMRLYPPVPLISRTLDKDLVVDGHTVPATTVVNVPIWTLHHNPAVWGEDHMEYKPSRFEEENVRKMDPFSYLPFSAGPRNCIGQSFALAEEKTVLARLLHRFTFAIADDCPPLSPIVRIILRSEKEIKLKVTRRF